MKNNGEDKKIYCMKICKLILISILIILLVVFKSNIYAQNKAVDSRQMLLKKETNDSMKVEIMNQIVSEFMFTDIAQAWLTAGNLMNMAKKSNNAWAISQANIALGNVETSRGNFKSALGYYKLAIEIQKESKDMVGLGKTYNSVGISLIRQAKYDDALIYLEKSLTIFEVAKINKYLIKILNNIGHVYGEKGFYFKAIEYFEKSSMIALSEGDKKSLAVNYNNIGFAYYEIGKYQTALEYYNRAMNLIANDENILSLALQQNSLGKVYFKLNDFQNSLLSQLQSLEFFNNLGDKYNQNIVYLDLAEIYIQTNQIDKAVECLNQSYKLTKSTNNEYLKTNTKVIEAKILMAEKKYAKALKILNICKIEFKRLNKNRDLAETYKHLASCNLKLKLTENAKIMYDSAYHFSKFNNNIELQKSILSDMAKYFSENNNYEEAYNCIRIASQLTDSMEYGETVQRLVRMEISQENNFTLMDKDRQKRIEDLEQKSQLTTQKWIIIVIIIAITILTVAFLKLNKNSKIIKIDNYKLQIQRDEIEKQRQELLQKNNVLEEQQIEILNKNNEIEAQKDNLQKIFSELQIKNNEISAQRNELEYQRDLVVKQKMEITDSIHYAKHIQNAILPTLDTLSSVFPDLFIMFRPRDIVSGDFYFMRTLPPPEIGQKDLVVLAVADCTGHGVPGAFMSMLGFAFLSEIVINHAEFKYQLFANEILNSLRDKVIKYFHKKKEEDITKDGMDISLIIYDPNDYTLQYAGAYNPIFIIRNGELQVITNEDVVNQIAPTCSSGLNDDFKLYEIKGNRMPIGVHIRSNEPFTNFVINMKTDDLVYMFTDGFQDQPGGVNGKKFRGKHFKQLLVDIFNLPLREQQEFLNTTMKFWISDYEQVDDILIAGFLIP